MQRLVVLEYGRIPRTQIGDPLLQKLQRFDEQHGHKSGTLIFDWSRSQELRATNLVGVVQIPGLTIEILPKIDTSRITSDGACEIGSRVEQLAQGNLLYMLSVARKVPLHERDLAQIAVQKRPLLDHLILLFAKRLLAELRRGIEHSYVYQEENLTCIKGKLLLSEHLRVNLGHLHRAFVGFDEFVIDTWLNRILKATCRKLLGFSSFSQATRYLRQAIIELDDAQDTVPQDWHFDQVELKRDSERFRPLLQFCRLVHENTSPSPSIGGLPSFSLLFSMDRLFEEFVGEFLKRNSSQLGIQRDEIHLQARGYRHWLLRTVSGQGRFRLMPDIVIGRSGSSPRLIIDTKWKRLLRDVEDRRNGVAQADIYQLYAYAHRYRCRRNLLLYPKVEGVTKKTYVFDDDPETCIQVDFVDVSYDLARNREVLIRDLKSIVEPTNVKIANEVIPS